MATGRNGAGQFIKGHSISKGNKGGTGRPSRSVEETYLRAIKDAMPPKRWFDCLQTYAALAEAGDRYALRFFADYLLGKPLERRELTGLGGQPLEIRVSYASDNTDPA